MAPPRRPWFRFYVETFGDIEIRSLPIAQRWVWAAVMGMARMSPVAGVLLDKGGLPVSDAMLAEFAGARLPDVRRALARWVSVGMLRRDEHDALVVVNWDKRQFESDDVTSRTKRHRERQTNVSSNGEGTAKERRCLTGTEVQRTDTDLLTPATTSSAPPGPDGGDVESVLIGAARLLAEAEAVRRGTEIGNPSGYVRARIPAIRSEREPEWRRLLSSAPTMTAEQLVYGQPPAVARVVNRDCDDCAGVGVVELEDGTYDDCACKRRSPV